jgi:predicted kinase
VRFVGLWLDAPPATLRRRVEARANDASDAGTAEVDRQLAQPVNDLGDWHRIDATGTPDNVLERTRALIEAPA